MFGVQSNWFNITDTGYEIQSSSKNGSYGVDAAVTDSNGNTRCRTKSGEAQEYQAVYRVCGGGDTNNQHNLDDVVEIGEVKSFDTVTHIQVSGIQLGTDNQNWPTVTVTGIQDTGAAAQTHPKTSTSITFLAKKKAQSFGLDTVSAGTYVTAGSVSITASPAECPDSEGNIAKREMGTVQARASNTLQNCTAEPSGTADTANGWDLDSPSGLEGSNSTHEVKTLELFRDLVRDGE